MKNKTILRQLAAACSSAAAIAFAMPAAALAQSAEDYPNRTISLYVPYPAGGAMDFVGRLFARHLGELTDQTVIVENRPGAGTAIAANALAKANRDGYTLMLAPNATLTITPQLYASPPFDPAQLEPLAIVGTNQMVLSAGGHTGIKSLDELIEKAKAEPESVSYGSFGNGNITHLLGELLSQATQAPLLHVPFQGAAPAMNNLVGGNITASFDTITNAQPQIEAGRIVGLAVTGEERSPLLPDVPTFKELGYPQLAGYTWVGIVAPAGMEDDLKSKVRALSIKVTENTELREQMSARGFDVPHTQPEDLEAYVGNERNTYQGVIEAAKIRLD